MHPVQLRLAHCGRHISPWSRHLAPDHVGLSAAVTTAKHEALRAAFGVALNQGEGTLAAAIAPTPHYVHLTGALSPLVTLADIVTATSLGVDTCWMAVAVLAVWEVVVAWAAAVTVLSLKSLQALALTRSLVTVGAQGPQLVAPTELATIDRVVAPSTSVAAVTTWSSCVLGADATPRLLVAHMAWSFTWLTCSAAMVSETVVTREANVASLASHSLLAGTLSGAAVTLCAQRSCSIAVAWLTARRRSQVPKARLQREQQQCGYQPLYCTREGQYCSKHNLH